MFTFGMGSGSILRDTANWLKIENKNSEMIWRRLWPNSIQGGSQI